MSIQTFEAGHYLPRDVDPGAYNLTTLVIDAAAEKVALIVPEIGETISKVHFRTGVVSVNAASEIKISLQSVSNTDGYPTGTILGTGNNAYGTIAGSGLSSNAWHTVDITDYTPSADEMLALVWEYSSFNAGDSIQIAGTLTQMEPYNALYTSSWAKTAYNPICAVEFAGPTYHHIPGIWGNSGYDASATFNSGTTIGNGGDERGNRIVLPYTARCCGAWVYFHTMQQDFTINVYEGTNSTPILSRSFDKDIVRGAGYYRFRFRTTATLTKDTVYRIAVKPLSTSNVGVVLLSVNAAALMGSMELGTRIYRTHTVDGDYANWSDVDTDRYMCGLIVDGIDVSSGGGVYPIINSNAIIKPG